jgi:hypothetical protein
MLFYIQDALVGLFLWRGTLPVSFYQQEYRFPIHSCTAFILCVIVIERPQLFPSFLMFGIAWLLLAIMGYRRSLPDVWSRCKSYKELSEALLLGESNSGPDSIAPFENYRDAQQFLESWKKRIVDSEEASAKAYESSVLNQVERQSDLDELGELTIHDLATKRNSMSMDPFSKCDILKTRISLIIVC